MRLLQGDMTLHSRGGAGGGAARHQRASAAPKLAAAGVAPPATVVDAGLQMLQGDFTLHAPRVADAVQRPKAEEATANEETKRKPGSAWVSFWP